MSNNPYSFPLIGSVQASPDQNNRNARADILLSRRKEKLKHDLVNGFGMQNESHISDVLARHGD